MPAEYDQDCVLSSASEVILPTGMDGQLHELAVPTLLGQAEIYYSHLAATAGVGNTMSTPYQMSLYYPPDSIRGNFSPSAQPIDAADKYYYSGVEVKTTRTSEVQVPLTEMSPTAMPITRPLCSDINICCWSNETVPGICGEVITCEDVPAHFKNVHHIENMNEFEKVQCKWLLCSKEVLRKNFIRHIRERHLEHSRNKHH